MRSVAKATVCLALGGASLALAQTPIPLSVSGNEARGTIELGGIGAELTIAFESAVGLTPAALDVLASLVDPLDPTLLGRLNPGEVSSTPLEGLSGGPQVGIPAAFPVLLRIAPSETSSLSFAGVATVSLHTFNLHLDPAVPLALFKAPAGGLFRDNTAWEGRGSYRVGGSEGDFSEFLIVIDNRPIDTVIVEKFGALQAILTENSSLMPVPVAGTLQTILSEARTQYDLGTIPAAIAEMKAFSNYVKAHSGNEIPDVWRANCTTAINLAGLLRSGAATLAFSLDRKTGC